VERNHKRFSLYSWIILLYNLGVILWGAYVRATGSGAGCGGHWPTCNGQVIPQSAQVQTMIEFTHRVSSGLTLVFAAILVVWAWRVFPKGSLLRWSAALALGFTLTEALVGAGLVLLGLVATNVSALRAGSVAIHLVNTLLLLAFLSMTAWWSTFGLPERLKLNGAATWLPLIGLLGTMLISATGAITALGDTLFPSHSLAEGVSQDFSQTANFLIRLRIYHPIIAVTVGVYLIIIAVWMHETIKIDVIQKITIAMIAAIVLQVCLGIVNVALLAPIWMQFAHLFVSDVVWISEVFLAGNLLGIGELAPGLGNLHVHNRIYPATK
jgi:heme A synthase